MSSSFLVLVAGAGLIVWAVLVYNRLVALLNRYRNAFAQIDVQLKRRHDLIPNLVETAKGYLAHERSTLEAVIAARNLAASARAQAADRPGDPVAMKGLSGAEAGLAGALGGLFALSEAYPDLKANQTMLRLMEELSSTENRIAFARQAFNDMVMVYNTTLGQFPNSIIAGTTGFRAAEMFRLLDTREGAAVQVSFG